MLEKVISGGQTGADQAGGRAAKAFSIATGGSMPLGFLTEEGPRPEFAERYGATELETASCPARTRRNVRDADATLWFGDHRSAGARATLDACRAIDKPYVIVSPGMRPSTVREWLDMQEVRVLNVAGNRESNSPGIGERVESFLGLVFRQLGHRQTG